MTTRISRNDLAARIAADIPEGATIQAELRGKRMPLTVCALPFVTPSYKR